MKNSTSSPVKAKSSITSSLSSPSKKLSKKQQKLAEAAKDTRCISQYFGKKQVDSSQMKGNVSSNSDVATSQDQSPSSSDTDFMTHLSNSADVSESADVVVFPSVNESPVEQMPTPDETEMVPEVSKDHEMKG